MSAEGTLRPETKCWAQGMDGWRPLQNIPQLKWYLLATGNAVMNETDLAVLILNMLIKICEFYPNRLQHQFYFYLLLCFLPWTQPASGVRDETSLAALPLRRAFFFKIERENLLPGYLECILETSGIPPFSTHILINIVINSIICVAQPVSSEVFVMLPQML